MVTTPHTGADEADARGNRPFHVADLLRLVTRDPGRPRLTWYGDDGERVELSGAVLENWVNKTTNLLVEEFDAEPGTRVVLDLPVHWRTVVWALAVWRVGATAVLADPGTAPDATTGAGRSDVVVTTRPAEWVASGAQIVAVALPALARRFDGDLPAGAIDAASAVMTYGDQVGWLPGLDPARAALTTAGETNLFHHGLVREGLETDAGSRRLIEGRDVRQVLLRLVRAYSNDGSAVLLSPSASESLLQDPVRRARILASERVDES